MHYLLEPFASVGAINTPGSTDTNTTKQDRQQQYILPKLAMPVFCVICMIDVQYYTYPTTIVDIIFAFYR